MNGEDGSNVRIGARYTDIFLYLVTRRGAEELLDLEAQPRKVFMLFVYCRTVMEALSQMWVAMLSWFTPTVLFVLLNAVIGTIVVTSGMRQSNNTNTNKDLRRNPSLLYRLSSFGLSRGRVEEVVEFENQEEEEEEEKMPDAVVVEEEKPRAKMTEERKSEVEVKTGGTSVKTQKKKISNGLGRSKSDTPPTADLHPTPLPRKLKKSGTFESPFSHFDSQALRVLEATPEVVNTVESDDNGPEDTEEVNAKADDFINKFKHQLKLQRLDSIMRYKDMFNRGK